jgi:uncharacterized protein (DUF486 family)
MYLAILISWGIAFFEYTAQVPANRVGHISHDGPFTAPQLKVIQEFITLVTFGIFSTYVLKERLRWADLGAFLFIFGGGSFGVRAWSQLESCRLSGMHCGPASAAQLAAGAAAWKRQSQPQQGASSGCTRRQLRGWLPGSRFGMAHAILSHGPEVTCTACNEQLGSC